MKYEFRALEKPPISTLAKKPSVTVNLQKEWIFKLHLEDPKKRVAQAKTSHKKEFAPGKPQALMRSFVEKRSKK